MNLFGNSHFLSVAEPLARLISKAGGYGFAALGAAGGRKRVRECVHGAELDLQTLVWTRGAVVSLGAAGKPPEMSAVWVTAGRAAV
jgi:hypothetical protein